MKKYYSILLVIYLRGFNTSNFRIFQNFTKHAIKYIAIANIIALKVSLKLVILKRHGFLSQQLLNTWETFSCE